MGGTEAGPFDPRPRSKVDDAPLGLADMVTPSVAGGAHITLCEGAEDLVVLLDEKFALRRRRLIVAV